MLFEINFDNDVGLFFLLFDILVVILFWWYDGFEVMIKVFKCIIDGLCGFLIVFVLWFYDLVMIIMCDG